MPRLERCHSVTHARVRLHQLAIRLRRTRGAGTAAAAASEEPAIAGASTTLEATESIHDTQRLADDGARLLIEREARDRRRALVAHVGEGVRGGSAAWRGPPPDNAG